MAVSMHEYYSFNQPRGPFYGSVAISFVLHLSLIMSLVSGVMNVVKPTEPTKAVVYNLRLTGGPLGNPAPAPTPKPPEATKKPPAEAKPKEPEPEPPKPKPEPPKPKEVEKPKVVVPEKKEKPKEKEIEKPKEKEKEKPKEKTKPEKTKPKDKPKLKPAEFEEEAPKWEQIDGPATRMADAPPTPAPGVTGTEIVPPELLSWINRVRSKVEQTWQQPGGLSLSMEKSTAQVSFWVNRNGALLTQPMVRDKSSSELLDVSGLEAIKLAAPFPRLPENFRKDSVEVVFNFTLRP